ncbi:MAG: HAMP domain-containing histidine kinase [Candidatus Rokubacteria bacterium]|nr:HAMP domain-containing histidine kinase [Candidatus Rokubacteria bacterium]
MLGGISLQRWAAYSDALFREQARDMAAMAADKIEMSLRHADDALLADLQAALTAGDPLDGFARRAPLVRRLYLFDRRGRMLHPAAAHPGDAGLFVALLGEISQGFWERGGRRDVVTGDHVVLAAILKDRAAAPVLAALDLDAPALGAEIAKQVKPFEGGTFCAVLDHTGRPVYSQGPLAGADLLVAVPFRDGLPSWRFALYQPHGVSPRASVRWQVMVFTACFGVLVLTIAAGSVATFRMVRRESEMARLKADFVANVSHDLKTPLSVIRMFSETLEMGRVPDEGRRHEYYRVIARESERLSRLIDNVLDFSRIEGGRRRYAPVPTALEPIVRETLETFDYPLRQGGFKVEVEIPPDLPPVLVDGDAVAQALANLVDNAIKYSGDRRALRIEARVDGARVGLSVADAGIGIPREEQTRIFEKFYRVGHSETQGRRGSGVGLALVLYIAEAHGGGVTVESTPGEGSRFTLWLPR